MSAERSQRRLCGNVLNAKWTLACVIEYSSGSKYLHLFAGSNAKPSATFPVMKLLQSNSCNLNLVYMHLIPDNGPDA